MLKVESKQKAQSFLEIVVGNIMFLTNIKKTKETKNFSFIGFISIITKNAKLKYP